MNKLLIALGVLVVIALMAFGWYQSGYNQAVEQFNTYQLSLFGSFFASITHLTQPAVYFKAPEQAEQAPVVKFQWIPAFAGMTKVFWE